MPSQKSTSSEKRQKTSFTDAIAISPIEGTWNCLSANIPWDWCGGTHAHGGYINSLIFSAARHYFLTTYPSNPQPDSINSHVQFLFPTEVGPARLSVRELSIGKQYSSVQIDVQKEQADGSWKTCTTAIVTQGNLKRERGVTIETVPMIVKEEIPKRETECERWELAPVILKSFPVAGKLTNYVPKGGKEGRLNDRHGLSIREVWMNFSDGTKFDTISLGFLCDMHLSAPTNYSTHMADLMTHVYPTVCASLEVKKDPAAAEWLFVKIRAHKIANGRFDEEVWVVDEKGELVALSKSVGLAVEQKMRDPKKMTETIASGRQRL